MPIMDPDIARMIRVLEIPQIPLGHEVVAHLK
jgi:hypothetical protein